MQSGLNYRITGLDFLRVAATLQILYNHTAGSFHHLIPAIGRPSQVSFYFGVSTLMVISGFLSLMIAEKGVQKGSFEEFKNFFVDRYKRFYPLYLAAFLSTVMIVYGARSFGLKFANSVFEEDKLLLEGFMLQVLDPTQLWNYPAWTLNLQVLALAVLFPAFFLVLKVVRHTKPRLLLLGGLLFLFAFYRAHPPNEWVGHACRVFFPFAIGMLLYRLRRDLLQEPPSPRILTVGLLLSIGGCYFGPMLFHGSIPDVFVTLIVVVSITAMIFLASFPNSLFARVGAWGWVQTLSTLSFSIYLSHSVAHRLINAVFNAKWFATEGWGIRLLVALLHLAIFMLVAAAFHYLVEMPFERWRKRRREARRRALVVTAVPDPNGAALSTPSVP